jgi:hypothetical protein
LTASDLGIANAKSENVSFRLNKDILTKLRREAEQKRISLNTLANQVLDQYVNFGASAKADMLPMAKEAVIELAAGYSEEEIKSIGQRVAKKIGTDIAYQLRGRYDFESLIDIFDYIHKASDIPYKHNIDEHNKDKHTFIVQFGMGRKWSLGIAEYWKAMFEPVSSKKVEYTITDSMLAITVEGKGGVS